MAVRITYLNIESKKQTLESKKEVIEVIEPAGVISSVELNDQVELGIDLYGTYAQNDLIINEIIEKYKGIEVEIPQIDGLKNKDIENKINKDMYNRIYEVIKKQQNVESAYFVDLANFSNVLSIAYYIQSSNGYSNISLNYNLVNGEHLNLEDIFVKDTEITDLIRKSFYEAIVKELRYSEEYSKLYKDVYDELEVIISPDENEVFNVVNGYLSSEEKLFAFSPSQIYLYYKDYTAYIKMIDVADKISIYTKYLTDESIFIRDDIGFENIFTCVDAGSYDLFDIIKYGYLEDNLWYDISNSDCYLPEDMVSENKFIEIKDNLYNQISNEIEAYREIARNNSDKFYIIISKPQINVEDKNLIEVRECRMIYEMPLDIYEEVYKNRLINEYRVIGFWMGNGISLNLGENEGVIITTLDSEKIYNYITGEEVK